MDDRTELDARMQRMSGAELRPYTPEEQAARFRKLINPGAILVADQSSIGDTPVLLPSQRRRLRHNPA